jgi:hypothetical protein
MVVRLRILLARGAARFPISLARGAARFPISLARGAARFDHALLLGRVLALLVCSGGSGCNREAERQTPDFEDAGDAAAPEDGATLREVRLIDHESWQNYPVELDPLADHQPPAIKCGIAGWFVEAGSLEVDTSHCNYLLIEHPAAVDVPAGSEIEIEIGHFDLLAPEPATAHLALLFDADLQWEHFVDIPGPGNLQRSRFLTTRDLAAGEPIRVHLHNHGQNTWLIGQLVAFLP